MDFFPPVPEGPNIHSPRLQPGVTLIKTHPIQPGCAKESIVSLDRNGTIRIKTLSSGQFSCIIHSPPPPFTRLAGGFTNASSAIAWRASVLPRTMVPRGPGVRKLLNSRFPTQCCEVIQTATSSCLPNLPGLPIAGIITTGEGESTSFDLM